MATSATARLSALTMECHVRLLALSQEEHYCRVSVQPHGAGGCTVTWDTHWRYTATDGGEFRLAADIEADFRRIVETACAARARL